LRHKTTSRGSVSQNDVGDVGCVLQNRLYIAIGRKVDASIRSGPVLKQSLLKRAFISTECRERHLLRADADKFLLQVVQATPDTNLGHIISHALPAGLNKVELRLGSSSFVGESERLDGVGIEMRSDGLKDFGR
jgi:hypothetical protein